MEQKIFAAPFVPAFFPGTNTPAPATLKAALDSRIDLNVRGATLAQVGRLLAGITECEIFVPATRIDERRDLYLQDVSLDAAVRELQLMALVRP
jgi:hypothetical protein